MDVPGERDDLWDLTRGDVDNRSSPQWRGWRALALTTVLEFNDLIAAITFVGGHIEIRLKASRW